MEIVVLGTSSMVPTKERNVTSIFFRYKAEGILFDCGEGTQRQMNSTGIPRTTVTKILISHWHGDHVSGLMGLLQTIGNDVEEVYIDLFGPSGTKERMYHLFHTCSYSKVIRIQVHECNPSDKTPEKVFDTEDYELYAVQLHHSTPCIGYAFVEKDRRRVQMNVLQKLGISEGPHLKALQEGKDLVWKGKIIPLDKATVLVKGRKVAFVTDTLPCDGAVAIAKDADILFCESTYADALADKAHEYKHLTASQAAQIANQAGAKKLVLMHFSQRYKNTQEIEENARTYFDNVVCGKDFMRIML